METVDELNLTEILTAVQDFMTQDGAISSGQRSFYDAFRRHLNAHEGVFKLDDVERLLLEAKPEAPEISEEEFIGMGEAILTRYRANNADALNERIRLLAEEEARKQALAESERAAREEENRLRAEEEERRLAEEAEAERLRLEEEERQRQAEEAERLRLEEEERQRQAEEARIQAELEAEAAAKQAYWDAQEALPGEEAKIVPDLPNDAQTPAGEDTSSRPLLPKLVAGVVLLGALIGMGLVLF